MYQHNTVLLKHSIIFQYSPLFGIKFTSVLTCDSQNKGRFFNDARFLQDKVLEDNNICVLFKKVFYLVQGLSLMWF